MILRRILTKVRSFIHRCDVWRFAVLSLPDVQKVGLQVKLTIERYDRSSECLLSTLAAIKGKRINWDRRWKRGHWCYIGRDAGTAVAYLWVACDGWRVRDNEKANPLPAGAFFLYDAITLPDWRGRGIYPALICRPAEDLHREAVKDIYLLVVDGNRPAQRGVEKVGFTFTAFTVNIHRVLIIIRFRLAHSPLLHLGVGVLCTISEILII